jgi:hypothetical protein
MEVVFQIKKFGKLFLALLDYSYICYKACCADFKLFGYFYALVVGGWVEEY